MDTIKIIIVFIIIIILLNEIYMSSCELSINNIKKIRPDFDPAKINPASL